MRKEIVIEVLRKAIEETTEDMGRIIQLKEEVKMNAGDIEVNARKVQGVQKDLAVSKLEFKDFAGTVRRLLESQGKKPKIRRHN